MKEQITKILEDTLEASGDGLTAYVKPHTIEQASSAIMEVLNGEKERLLDFVRENYIEFKEGYLLRYEVPSGPISTKAVIEKYNQSTQQP